MTLLILGADGQVGSEICRAARKKNQEIIALNRQKLDITDLQKVIDTIIQIKPSVVVNAAAYTLVDKAETESEKAFAVNHQGPKILAEVCVAYDIPLIHLSTDYVFNGKKTSAYNEQDSVDPIGVYAASKWLGEQAVRGGLPKHIILRVSWVFGSVGNNFVKTILRLAKEREELKIVADQHGCPTYAADIADAVLQVIEKIKNATTPVAWGTYHYVGQSATTWFDFAVKIISLAKQNQELKVKHILPITTADYPTLAVRPANSELNCQKIREAFAVKQQEWKIGLEKMIAEMV